MSRDQEVRTLVDTDPDYINIRRFGCSLRRLIDHYPDGDAPNRIVAQALAMTEAEVESLYQSVVDKLRDELVL